MAWRVRHKLLEGMRQREPRRRLQGVVSSIDTVFGGGHAGKLGHGPENKAPFMAAVVVKKHGNPWHVRFYAMSDDKGATLSAWAEGALDSEVQMVTERLANFSAAGGKISARGAIIVADQNTGELEPFR